jgi:phage tail-like protein
MADDGSKQSASIWPLVKFAFKVMWDGTEIIFQEVSGLAAETTPIEYRGGSSKVYSAVKMPGLLKYGNVTFKKGIFKGDAALWDKFNALKMNTIKRVTIVINLLDESAGVAMTWTLHNAFPIKITGTEMKSETNEVAIESIDVAHEGLVISK